jgi:Ca2+-binding RTX toxin-like protein
VPANVDTITDFTPVDDTIVLDRSFFAGAGPAGYLTAARFFVGAGAHDATDRVIYDRSTGNLYYDADGTGAAAKKLVAHLPDHLSLTHIDFVVVA